jgi:hypothetical protein
MLYTNCFGIFKFGKENNLFLKLKLVKTIDIYGNCVCIEQNNFLWDVFGFLTTAMIATDDTLIHSRGAGFSESRPKPRMMP